MGRYTKETGGDFKQPPAGNHPARCYKIVDLGTQVGEYQGEPTVRNQVLLTWELPTELMDDGRPFSVSAFVTNSLNEKAKLRGWLEAWRGKAFTPDELEGFDLEKILGTTCMLNVIHNAKGKAVVSSIARLPKGLECPVAVNEKSVFWIEQWDADNYNALPDGIKKIIQQSKEYTSKEAGGFSDASPAGHFDDMSDDIPF